MKIYYQNLADDLVVVSCLNRKQFYLLNRISSIPLPLNITKQNYFVTLKTTSIAHLRFSIFVLKY